MDLVEFVRARLDEDEESVRYTGGEWRRDGINSVLDADGRLVVYGDGPAPTGAQADHIARHDPARVLRDVQATRRIVDEHHPVDPCDAHDELMRSEPCPTLRLVASRWDDHDDYQDEWRE